MKEFISAVNDSLDVSDEDFVEFKVDDRVLRSYTPHAGQLTFMLAALGRGQSNDAKFASIINLVMSTLQEEDADYLEGRLLERNPRNRLSVETVEQVVEYLVEEWFATPTKSPSDSVPSPPTGGAN